MKYALRQIRNNKMTNIVVLVQLVLVFSAAVTAASVLSYEYRLYKNFGQYLDGDGLYMSMTDICIDDYLLHQKEQVEEHLKKAHVVACYELWLETKDGEELARLARAYDREIIDSFIPKLQSGRWLSTVEPEENVIHAVVSATMKGYDVGDEIVCASYFGGGEDITIRIVGVLKKGAKIFGHYGDEYISIGDYRELYSDLPFGKMPKPVLLMNNDELMMYSDKHVGEGEICGIMRDNLLVRYDEDISAEEREENEAFLRRNADGAQILQMQQFRENSWAYITQRALTVLPLFLTALLMAFTSTVCTGAISVKRQMKKYAVYYLCGMPQYGFIKINGINAAVQVLAGFAITVCLYLLADYKKVLRHTAITLGWIEIAVCIAVGLLHILVVLLLSHSMVKKREMSMLQEEW